MSLLKSFLTFPNLRDRPCWRCGYSLRNLPADVRNCPECGLAVRVTLSANKSLSFADPTWLARLSRACFLLSVALMITVLVTCAWFLEMQDRDFNLAAVFVGPMCLILTLAVVYAWWSLATPPPYARFTTPRAGWILMRFFFSMVLIGSAIFLFGVPRRTHFLSIGGVIAWVWLLGIFHAQVLTHALRIVEYGGKRWLREVTATFAIIYPAAQVLVLALPCLHQDIEIWLGRDNMVHLLWVPVIACVLVSVWWLVLSIQFRSFREEADLHWTTD